ncbi:MAG: ArsC/Spx/MgsR family protein [Bacteroidota bacterium]
MDHIVVKSDKSKPEQITLYYNPDNKTHVKTRAHAESIGEILPISFEDMPTSNNIWTEVWKHVSEKPLTILDREHPKYDTLGLNDVKLDYVDWHKVVTNNTELIRSPIVQSKEGIFICHRPTEIYQAMKVEVEKTY